MGVPPIGRRLRSVLRIESAGVIGGWEDLPIFHHDENGLRVAACFDGRKEPVSSR